MIDQLDALFAAHEAGQPAERAFESEAKLALFDPEHGKRGVVCLDTAWGARVVAESRIPVTAASLDAGSTLTSQHAKGRK